MATRGRLKASRPTVQPVFLPSHSKVARPLLFISKKAPLSLLLQMSGGCTTASMWWGGHQLPQSLSLSRAACLTGLLQAKPAEPLWTGDSRRAGQVSGRTEAGQRLPSLQLSCCPLFFPRRSFQLRPSAKRGPLGVSPPSLPPFLPRRGTPVHILKFSLWRSLPHFICRSK